MPEISLQTRFGTLGTGLDLLGVGVAVIWPDNAIYFAVSALIVGTILIFISILPAKLFDDIATTSWRAWFFGFIQLHKAAKRTYEKTRKNVSAGMAETDIGNFEADPYGWYGHALVGKAGSARISVFGCKPYLDYLDEIPPEEINRHYLVVTETEAHLEDTIKNKVKYNRLYIKKSEMKKRIKEIEGWG